MKRRVFASLLVLVLALAGVRMAAAQPTIPTIVTFTSSLDAVSLADVEAGDATAELSWTTVGLTEGTRLTLHRYHQNRWVPVFDDNSVPLEPSGSRRVTVMHPQNFGPPTFLLSIVDAQSRILEQRPLTIPYDVSGMAAPPQIDTFTADLQSVDAEQVAAGAVLVTVTWDVLNRAPNSNLVFEQVYADGAAVSVELPRDMLWVPSAGSGPVRPLWRQGEDALTLRLRVVDLVSGNVYDEARLTLPATGNTTVPSSATPLPPPPPAQAGTGGGMVTPGGNIVAFGVSPDRANPRAPVTLAWELRGAGGVTVEQIVPGTELVQTVVAAQSPRGSATVYLPENAFYSVTYRLWTADRTESAEVQVQVHCPYTFFFGQADGCPASQAFETQGVYQDFEGGYMIGREDTGEVYVFYEDGVNGGSSAYFLESSFPAPPTDATAEPDEAPPLDRYRPIGMLGRVWSSAPGVAERLGWALAPAQDYRVTFQQVATTREPPPPYLFYLTLPNGRVIGNGIGGWAYVT